MRHGRGLRSSLGFVLTRQRCVCVCVSAPDVSVRPHRPTGRFNVTQAEPDLAGDILVQFNWQEDDPVNVRSGVAFVFAVGFLGSVLMLLALSWDMGAAQTIAALRQMDKTREAADPRHLE